MDSKLLRGLLPCLFLALSFLTLSNCTKEDTNPKLVYVHDTIVRHDTVNNRDTIIRGDTVFIRDTVLVRDTIYVGDTSGVPQLRTYSGTLGAQNSSSGSFFSSFTGNVYLTGDSANFLFNKVDISFAQVTSAGIPKFISPDARRSFGLTRGVTLNIHTLFATTPLTVTQFDAATSQNLNDLSVFGSTSVDVVEAKVYQFISPDGKKGLLHVQNLSATPNSFYGTVTIRVKVQE